MSRHLSTLFLNSSNDPLAEDNEMPDVMDLIRTPNFVPSSSATISASTGAAAAAPPNSHLWAAVKRQEQQQQLRQRQVSK
jgi:hypothetical protein